MVKIKFLSILFLGLVVACSEKESVTQPDSEPMQSSAAGQSSSSDVAGSLNSADVQSSSSMAQISAGSAISSSSMVQSSTGTAQSSASIRQEPKWTSKYPVTIDEGEGTFTIHFSYGDDACSIGENSAEWVVNSQEIPVDMLYRIDGKKLSIWSLDDVNDISLFNGDNESIFGTWYSENRDYDVKFTSDTFYTTENLGSTNSAAQVPVESDIDIASSYIMYDLYNCNSDESHCVFNHWHFTKQAPDFILGEIQKKTIDIREKTDRTVKLTFAGKEFYIQVDHVQLDSLNNGKTLIAASIQSQGATCNFEHASMAPTRELCTVENLKYLSDSAYEGEDGKVYSTEYSNDNSVEFSYCVKDMFK